MLLCSPGEFGSHAYRRFTQDFIIKFPVRLQLRFEAYVIPYSCLAEILVLVIEVSNNKTISLRKTLTAEVYYKGALLLFGFEILLTCIAYPVVVLAPCRLP